MLQTELKFEYARLARKGKPVLANCTSVTDMKIIRKSESHFRERLRKSRLRQESAFAMKKRVSRTA